MLQTANKVTIKLNLGCGLDRKEGYKGVDIRPLPTVDFVADVRALPFDDASVEEIFSQDIIEHLPSKDIEPTLREWQRVLIPGGILEMRTPDFFRIFRAAIIRRLPSGIIFHLIFGDQSESSGGAEWGSHKFGCSQEEWEELLKRTGYTNITVNTHPTEYNLHLLARKA